MKMKGRVRGRAPRGQRLTDRRERGQVKNFSNKKAIGKQATFEKEGGEGKVRMEERKGKDEKKRIPPSSPGATVAALLLRRLEK
jgi:hypothetical protein